MTAEHDPEMEAISGRVMAAAPDSPGQQWVKVEFYGLMPPGQVIVGLDPIEVAGNLMQAFGFDHISGLTVVAGPLP